MPTAPSSDSTSRAFLGLGSNLGDRRRQLEAAVARLGATAGLELVAVSSWLETEPVGGPPQGLYLNGALELRCTLTPRALLSSLLEIEQALGRERTVRWGPRTIDLDILLYGQQVLQEPELIVPHPRLLERSFVLAPLAEIAPRVIHPLTGRSIADHLADLRRRLAPAATP